MSRNPDVILVGDIHYRDDQPRCRLDDFWETQKRKALWLRELWVEKGRPLVLQPGDLFHRWNSSPRVINAVMEYLPPMVTMPGNPGKHNYYTPEGWQRDALAVLKNAARGWKVITNTGTVWRDNYQNEWSLAAAMWEEDLRSDQIKTTVLMTHRMILGQKAQFEGEYADDFLLRHLQYNLILTGHNHQPFDRYKLISKRNKSILVNPGSFTRQTADETHEPRVYLWWARENRVEPVYVPIDKNAVSREHIDEPAQRDERIAAFVERLDRETLEISLSFKLNVEEVLKAGDASVKVRARVMEVVDGD